MSIPIPNNDTHALFLSMVEGRPFGQQTLLDLESELLRYGIQITPPNSRGERTKIGDPISLRWHRVGFGELRWVWVRQVDVYTPPADEGPATPPPPVEPEPASQSAVLLAMVLARLEAIDSRLTVQEGYLIQARAALDRVYTGKLFGYAFTLTPKS